MEDSGIKGTLLDGRYRLGATIGSGGMSRIFEAEDLRLGRQVAIKLLHTQDDREPVAERLFREAKAAARANHPAVVTVFAYGTDEARGVDYLVMERLHGQDLGARIAEQGAQSIEFARRIGLHLADALAAVHATHVVHRDLKPSNVFLARRGARSDEVKLLDFGVAKHLDLHTLTDTGEVVGSLAYMAPEQLRDPKDVDARADIYAVGVLLYECLSGKPRLAARDVFALSQLVLRAESPPLRGIRPEVPQPLADIIERCMARDADNRYPNANTLYEALSSCAP